MGIEDGPTIQGSERLGLRVEGVGLRVRAFGVVRLFLRFLGVGEPEKKQRRSLPELFQRQKVRGKSWLDTATGEHLRFGC